MLIGAGPALFAAPLVRIVLAPIEREQYALASSAEESMRLVGQTLALGSAAAVFGLLLGGVPAAAAPPGALLGAIRLIAWLDLALVASRARRARAAPARDGRSGHALVERGPLDERPPEVGREPRHLRRGRGTRRRCRRPRS